MARIKPGVPTVKEIREGESEYRYISGTGLVLYTRYSNQIYSTKMHAASTPPVMDKKLEMAIGDRIGDTREGGEFIRADGTVDFTGNQSHGGHNIINVNDLDIDGALDVDGATTLDQTTIVTADGAFSVSGSNNIGLTTTGSADINLTSADKLEFSITGDCNWDTTTVDWDNSSTFDLTSVGNITIETSGATETKTILLFNDNNPTSESFHGIDLKVDAQDASNCQNNIFIECDGRAAKGGGIGVDIRSEDGVLIRGENATNGNQSLVQIRATATVDIGGGTDNITATNTTPHRTKIHGVFDVSNLYMSDPDVPIVMDNGTIAGGAANEEYTKFEALDTQKLIRAMTYKTSTTAVYVTDATCDVDSGDDEVGHDANSNILEGQKVTGTGIQAGTYVGTINSTTSFDLVSSGGLSRPANATNDPVTLSFFNVRDIPENFYIGIVNTSNDDLATGTSWLVTINFEKGSTNYTQLWLASKSANAPIIVLLGESTAGCGLLTWTSSTGILWQNNFTSEATFVYCSALRLQSGDIDF